MQNYLDLLQEISDRGRRKDDRTGVGSYSLFGTQLRFNLGAGFPALTTKAVNLKAVVHELLWFISGGTNINDPVLGGVKIWDQWAVKPENLANAQVDDPGLLGSIGPLYGAQWRNFNGVDQLAEVLKSLAERPDSRRHVISAWNPAQLADEKLSPEDNVLAGNGALAPCHTLFQFNTERLTPTERRSIAIARGLELPTEGIDLWLDTQQIPKYILDLSMYQRSADVPIGVPFNIASYALLLALVANQLNYVPGDYIHFMGDAHIYTNQLAGVGEQLRRTPKALPKLVLKCPVGTSIFDVKPDDIELVNYNPDPWIKMPVAK